MAIRVLVVDDYQPWQDAICSMIEGVQGLQVIGRASDGLEAVMKAEELQPDLIVLDIGLPKLNGIEAALQIRPLAPKSRILFVSDHSSRDIVDAAMTAGAVGYIAKASAHELPLVLQSLRCCLAQNNSHPSAASQANVYEEIVDAAVSLMHSDFASVQMLFPERGAGGELRLLATRGFSPEATRLWEWVRADSKCTCGIALRDVRRVVAPDIAVSSLITDPEDREGYFRAGIASCQTTPLITGSGEVVGMISTHWRAAHEPSDADLRRFDILARGVTDVLEARRRESRDLRAVREGQ